MYKRYMAYDVLIDEFWWEMEEGLGVNREVPGHLNSVFTSFKKNAHNVIFK